MARNPDRWSIRNEYGVLEVFDLSLSDDEVFSIWDLRKSETDEWLGLYIGGLLFCSYDPITH